ncbi:hypothetical protein C922_05709 [Plasmodium inui San Antonio 1]|uniref:Uncharacterized protein n=1 Tax=Plasmodium inui San Antonio 1 TaxID=1237626 RepID=W7A489_9APIC|nr:hypothetical protein C922_05709 [Plasmodium inui San Antonio 1]EUD63909.1 hypothetical protein C922_05709 [Plasmodium inui San Antonio 1]
MNIHSEYILSRYEFSTQNKVVNRTILFSHHYPPKKSYCKGYFTHKGRTLHTSCSCWYSSIPGDPYNWTTSTFIEQYYADI